MLKRRCRSCAETYITTDAELKRFQEQKLTVPGHCKKCRRINRLEEELKKLKKFVYKYVAHKPI